ncbi:MAG: hypothetical protein GY866_29685 [Proteobacteria bacterium]|nr:hypothetical protein [Pseudomonadota bacterium]
MIEQAFKKHADYDHFRDVVFRKSKAGPVPIVELIADGSIMGEVTGMDYPVDSALELADLLEPGQQISGEALEAAAKFLDLSLAFGKAVGYDTTMAMMGVPIPHTKAQYSTVEGKEANRAWQDEHNGIIPDRKAFEAFQWPSTDLINTLALDYVGGQLPEGMKIHLFVMGVFEDLRSIMGFENMAIKSIEEPQLLGDILDRITALKVAAVERAGGVPEVGAVFYADDMGTKTSTMVSPDFFRQWVIPCQKRIAEACHNHGIPFLFHSCGQIDGIMDDLIDEVGIDAIHSFEDAIEPVESFYRRYGDRVAVLGGVDVDLLSRGTPEQVRSRCRQILDVCGHEGGYAMGSGNSVTNYCRIENYYAMIDETRRWNEARGYL